MLLFVLIGCYERVVMDARVDAHRGEVRLVVQEQGADNQIDSGACEGADGCLAAIRAHLATERTELEGQGARELVNGVFLRDGELDLVAAYTVSLDAKLLAGGGPLRMVTSVDGRGRSRSVVGVLQTPDTDDGRSTVTATGRYTRYDTGEAGVLWVFPRGKSTVHLEQQLRSDGQDAVVEPWVAGVPGLEAAIRTSGLLLDPATLIPR